MHPHEKFAIQRFEESLTRPRGGGGGGWSKSPFFVSPLSRQEEQINLAKVGANFLSGICALTAIADKEEKKVASTVIEDLFEGVWKNEVVVRPKENTDTYVKSVKVLQAIYPSLV